MDLRCAESIADREIPKCANDRGAENELELECFGNSNVGLSRTSLNVENKLSMCA